MSINNTVPNLLSSLKPKTTVSPFSTPAQSALSSKIGLTAPKINFPTAGFQGFGGGTSGGTGTTATFPGATPPVTSTGQNTNVITQPTQQPLSAQPVTGNVQTPSGATVNSSTGGLVTPPAQSPQATYPGLVSGLASFNPFSNPQVSDAYKKAQDINDQIAASKKNEAGAVAENRLNPIPIGDQTGREAVIQNQYLSQQNALSSQLQGQSNLFGAGLTGTGQQVTAQTQAAGFAQPQLAGFNQQAFNPLTSQFGSGQTGTTGNALSQLPAQAQSAIQSYAQQVQNGSMTRADAESRLSAYGVAGTNALNEVLGSGFNTNASNASAGTTATGQQIQTAASSTNKALDTLSSAFAALPAWQTGGIPATNSLANWIASNLGSSALTQYKTNLADARSQLIGVLNSSGGTPTGNEATAEQYLPDNMTKAQFDQNVGTAQSPGIVRQLIAQKVGSFTNSGQQNNATTNSNLFSW